MRDKDAILLEQAYGSVTAKQKIQSDDTIRIELEEPLGDSGKTIYSKFDKSGLDFPEEPWLPENYDFYVGFDKYENIIYVELDEDSMGPALLGLDNEVKTFIRELSFDEDIINYLDQRHRELTGKPSRIAVQDEEDRLAWNALRYGHY